MRLVERGPHGDELKQAQGKDPVLGGFDQSGIVGLPGAERQLGADQRFRDVAAAADARRAEAAGRAAVDFPADIGAFYGIADGEGRRDLRMGVSGLVQS